jgi:CubicO group peptidase (beta-lactamase class C family)
MNETKLNEAVSYAGGSGYIIRYGKVVKSWGNTTQRFDLKSTSKSIGVTTLGLALDDGLVSLNDAVQPYYPELGVPPTSNSSTGWLDDITVVQLATHTAGFDKAGGYEALLFEPGTKWSYSDGGANWLADVLTLRYGEDLNSLLFREIFTPIGIKPAELVWRTNQYRSDTLNGIKRREFGSGINASVNALARIGYLYLRGGKWNGQQLLSSSFIEAAGKPVVGVVGLPEHKPAEYFNASDHYGLLWWNNADGTMSQVPTDAYWGWGLGDSLMIVIPSLDLVVVRAGPGWRSDWTPDYTVLEPFLNPIVLSIDNSP